MSDATERRLPAHITEEDVRLITEIGMPSIVALVRADQIEKDAAIADVDNRQACEDSLRLRSEGAFRLSDMKFGRSVGAEYVAAAIRAQLDGPTS